MPVGSRLFADIGLLYVRFSGVVTIAEIEADFLRSETNPDYHPSMRHLFDLSEMTCCEVDPVAFMAFQARILEAFSSTSQTPVLMFLAPTEAGRALLAQARKSWDENGHIVLRGAETEREALDVLGLDWTSMPEIDTADR